MREGTTVFLPVFHPGALFYFGDGHAAQGDGEVCGSGLETSMEVAFRFGLRKGKPIAWPRFEDAEHIMVAGSARPLSDALRIAFVELVQWLVADYGFEQGGRLPARLAGRRGPRGQHGRPALHGRRQVPEDASCRPVDGPWSARPVTGPCDSRKRATSSQVPVRSRRSAKPFSAARAWSGGKTEQDVEGVAGSGRWSASATPRPAPPMPGHGRGSHHDKVPI